MEICGSGKAALVGDGGSDENRHWCGYKVAMEAAAVGQQISDGTWRGDSRAAMEIGGGGKAKSVAVHTAAVDEMAAAAPEAVAGVS